MEINILGQQYEIIKIKNNKRMEELKVNGLCETQSKQIFIDDFDPTIETLLNSNDYKDKVLRHEIIHAFLYESGLPYNSKWAENEVMVDFFAIQIPKMLKSMKESRCLNEYN